MHTIPLNQKVSNLVQYINELTQLKQKPVYSHKNYEDVLWIDRIPLEIECLDAFRNDLDDWLYVKKPKFPTLPVVPKEIQEWIIIDSSRGTISVNNSIVVKLGKTDEGEQVTEEFFLKDLPDVVNEIKQFQDNLWNPYREEYERVNDIQSLYDQLYKIHQELHTNCELLELVVSVGLLQWKQDDKSTVERHLLTSAVELQFNKERAEITIVPSFKGIHFEFEEDMLLVEDRLSGDDNKEIQSLLNSYHQENTIGENFPTLLTHIVNALDSRGTYVNAIDIPSCSPGGPLISLSPAFILRKKSQKSFQFACDTAVEQLKEMDDSSVPENMANMFGRLADVEGENHADDAAFRQAQEFYFPLVSNEEQGRIISTLNNKSSVLVQGPPGTGKTHTIANLTSHLLATGQRVLITSQTAKALSVLKSKLPEELQNLSVSLLGGDSASMKDLEKVVSTISVNKERFDLTDMASTVEKKETALKRRKEDLNKTKTELMEIRETETYIHPFDPPYSGTAQQIAIQLNADTALYDWYTTPVNTDTADSYLLKEKELVSRFIELKNTDMEVPVGYDQFDYPALPQAVDLNRIVQDMKEELNLKSQYASLIGNEVSELQGYLTGLSDEDTTTLQTSLSRYDDLLKPLLFNTYPKLKKVIQDIFDNRSHLWEKIQQDLTEHLAVIDDAKNNFDLNLVLIDGVPTASLKKMAEDLSLHFADGGTMGNFLVQPQIVKQYKPTLQKVTYNGLPIKSEDDVKKIHAYARTKYAYENTEKLVVPHLLEEKPFVEDLAFTEYETVLSQLNEAIQIQQWRAAVLSDVTSLSADTFNEQLVHSLRANIELFHVKNALQQKSEQLRIATATIENELTVKVHPLYAKMIAALNERKIEDLQALWAHYEHFQQVMNRDNTVKTISNKIGAASPVLLEQLESTYQQPIWTQRIAIWDKAQYWKQQKSWLYDFAQKDEAALSSRFDQLEKEISETITEIGTAKAWISMLSTMTDSQSRHLKAWARSVKNIGKGTGKNAPRYIAEAQMHMEQCKEAIPAWIMPLNRVFENFEIRPGLFDIVIVDEASQSWHDALLLKYLAKKMIIVGDDKQISPSIVGIQVDDINKLNHKYLKPIEFEFADTLNAANSFFDVAYIMFKETITLREHFRCMPEIIGFSNRISYPNSPLIPLRQYPANRLEPIISRYLPHGVREGSAQNASNEVEADEIVKEIKNCINNPHYAGKTIGVISLLGNNQAKLIQTKLIAVLGAELMEERKIICGDAYAFQGDERDVIFLSMVASLGETRLTAQVADSARQRYNVSVSRAKDQLWVMHSISVNDISNPDCLRYQLLTYIADPLKEETEANRQKCESKFEENVFDAIVANGYRVIPQYEVAGFRMDLVIQGEQSKLVVECDGDHWHTSVEDRERDFLRERLLQRAGWTFWRVLGSMYYNNPEKALESLWVMLDEMKIRPYDEWANAAPPAAIEYTRPTGNDVPVVPISQATSPVVEKIISATKQQSNEKKFEQPSFFTIDKSVALTTGTHTKNSQIKSNDDHISTLIEEMKELGFEIVDNRDKSETLYVIGGKELEQTLYAYRSQGIAFSRMMNGNKSTDFRPAWYAKIKV
ncbi:AAA domain-containing protein [Sporosarcina limicola]|uniref:Very-short-patch-repair endonuclease n=1 Tax=Sporosarcina limicola TaxID=34101 RepID=A0A927MM57_9BACL|nr:AAA domain-containing protein [Sporosarcina limicola]MBE1555652.1 very-short-patch-repair endonuclease [Sporosarcina limicola]